MVSDGVHGGRSACHLCSTLRFGPTSWWAGRLNAHRSRGLCPCHDRTQDLEEQPADGGGRVDSLVEDDQVDPAGLKVLGQLDEVLPRAAETVEFGHAELVAFAGNEEGLVEFGAAGELAGYLVGEDFLAAGRAERVLLGFGVLFPSPPAPAAAPAGRSPSSAPAR